MDNLFSNLNRQIIYIVLDTETTGLSALGGDAIIEIAALKISEDGQTLAEFEEFINPKVPISLGAQLTHGISDEFIAGNGRPMKEVMPAFARFCENGILVGHNVEKFDMAFINKHLSDIQHPPLKNKIIDTLTLSRQKLQLPSYKLQTVAGHFGIPYKNAHRAMNDVKINKDVFLELLKL